MAQSREFIVYKLLLRVFKDKAYSQIELNKILSEKPDGAEYITMLFYGVLEKSIQFDYIISRLVKKPPKNAEAVIIKIGLYLMRYSDTPPYAAVNKTVELCKEAGKSGAAGFINAVLKNSVNIVLPPPDSEQGLSIAASAPVWLVKQLVLDYGFEFAKDMLLCRQGRLTHIRRNKFNTDSDGFYKKYPFLADNVERYGYYVTGSTLKKMSKSDFVIQGESSVRAAELYFEPKAQNILDLCAAPGGKTAYLLEKYYFYKPDNNSEAAKKDGGVRMPSFTACDIHPHRVELIDKYIKSVAGERYKSFSILAAVNDAAVINADFKDKFDLVICDVPCSGTGTIASKPEILFFKKEEDIESLAALQLRILSTAAQYVKNGGALCYSTCSVLKKENDGAVEQFLKANKDFVLSGEALRIFPHTDGSDGFFAVKFKKEQQSLEHTEE